MADEEKKQEESPKDNSNDSSNKLILIVIIILLLLLLVVGGLVAYFLLADNNEEMQQPQQQKTEEVKKKKVSKLVDIGPIYPLDQFIVNLVSNSSSRYLKAKIDLEMDTPELQQELDKKLPAIRDLIIRILSSKTVEEIQTAQGKEKLKEEIKRKINQILSSGEIRNVYFTEFVIQ